MDKASILDSEETRPRRLVFREVTLERIETSTNDDAVVWEIGSLWIFGTPPPNDGKGFALVRASPNKWEVGNSVIQLPDAVDGIDCVIRSEEGKWVAFTHVDCSELRLVDVQSETATCFEIETMDPRVRLMISWRAYDEPLENLINAEELPLELDAYGSSFIRRFNNSGGLTDIHKAISAFRRAVELTPPGCEDELHRLSRLGNARARLFERAGNLEDIQAAIGLQTKAINLASKDNLNLPGWHNNLGNSFQCLFDRTGSLDDIDKAILAQRTAIKLTVDGDPSLPIRLNNLGNSYQARFERTGALDDITGAIECQQQAVGLTPEDHDGLPIRLNNLGISFRARFDCSGDLEYIAESIGALQAAIQATPVDHAGLPARLTNLGSSFQTRFERDGNFEDIAEAISALEMAVKLTPAEHPELSGRHNNLGSSYLARYERAGDALDIEKAISNLRAAVKLSPDGHPKLPGQLNNLANALEAHFERGAGLCTIDEAISCQRMSVELTPVGSAELPTRLNTLANSFLRRFESTELDSDLANAVAAQQQSVDLTPDGHASRPSRLKNLGTILYRKALASGGTIGDMEASIASFKAAATSIAGSPRIKLHAATSWARCTNQFNPSSKEVICAYDVAVGLVSLIAGLEQTIDSRFSHLQQVSGLASEAASVAFRLDRPQKAVEWLEQGRCLVWNQLNNLRTPLDDLRIHDEQLTERVLEVARALEHSASTRPAISPEMSLLKKISLEGEARSHLSLARQWEDLLAIVRALPGFENFLKPAPFAALAEHLPESGAVVVINVGEQRCDAVVLRALSEPLHVPLPDFSITKATTYRNNLKNQLQRQGLRMRGEEIVLGDFIQEGECRPTGGPGDSDGEGEIGLIELVDELHLESDLPGARGLARFPQKRGINGDFTRNVLRDVWHEVAKPVIDALGYVVVASPERVPPRIWWCPTGPLSFLPLHAAGAYEAQGTRSVLDYAVSSYTPTVTAIIDRVKNDRPIAPEKSGLALTCQPKAPGASPIPGTTTEVNLLFSKATESGTKALKLEGDEVSVEGWLGYMDHFSNIHLACHGAQNTTDPLQSRFLFHDGPLTLGRIIQSNLQNADLAFLSACQTGVGEERLSDEAVHLAAGMLAAGYRRVVGTMWSIADRYAPDVASDFYQYLWSRRADHTNTGFDGAQSAHALHHAIQRLRARLDASEQSLLAWVPYAHFGY